MSLQGFRFIVVGGLATACCVLAISSCRSPSAPSGRVLVHVTQDGVRPAPGKRIELVGTSLAQSTDENGQATFHVRAGSYVVRAYDIGTPGPGRLYVEQSVEVRPAQTTEAQFNDCTMCRAPSQ